MKKRNLKNERGITLIALVVTIVVLLILAGISINAVLGDNGLITRAKDAQIETRGAQVEDLVALYKSDNEIEKYSNIKAQTEEELLQDLKNRELVEDEEIDAENKTITIGSRVISYALPEAEIDKTALKFLVNSGEDGIVVLPIASDEYGEDGYEVDWGDGTTGVGNIVANAGATHTYTEKNKEYIVTITGKCESIYSYYGNVTRDKIIEVLQWGETGLTSVDLEYCPNLRKIASPTVNSFINIESFEWTFSYCTGLTSIPEDLFANCPNVTNFRGTFCDCTGLTNIPEDLFVNCPNVTVFSATFRDCTGLTNIPEDLFANCPNVTNFKNTFSDCTGLTNIPEDLFVNCPNVTDFSATFRDCTGLTSIPEDLFANCPNVTDFDSTFYNCTDLTGNAPKLWERVPNGAENEYNGTPDGGACFKGCYNLSNYEQIPDYWKNTPPEN